MALSDSGFLFDVTTGHTYTLNKTGTFILKCLIDGKSAEAAALATAENFIVSKDMAKRDIERFLSRLSSLGLLPKGA